MPSSMSSMTASPGGQSSGSGHIHNLKILVHDRVEYVVATSYQASVHLVAVINGHLTKLESNWEPYPGETCSTRLLTFSNYSWHG